MCSVCVWYERSDYNEIMTTIETPTTPPTKSANSTILPLRTAMSMMPMAFSSPSDNFECIIHSYLDILIAYDSAQHGITRSYLDLLTAYSAQHPPCPPCPTTPNADIEVFALCTKCCEVFDTFDLVITSNADTNHTQILCADCLAPPA